MTERIYDIFGGIVDIENVESFMTGLSDFSKKHSVFIQVLNAEMICGNIHLRSATDHALRARDENRMSTQSIQMEILLYASGERQLTHAIPKMGVKKGRSTVGVVILIDNKQKGILDDIISLFIKDFSVKKDDSVLESSIEKVKRWGCSDEELNTVSRESLEDVILERIAMVDIIK